MMRCSCIVSDAQHRRHNVAHILTITILALIILVTFLAASLVDVIADIICARAPTARVCQCS